MDPAADKNQSPPPAVPPEGDPPAPPPATAPVTPPPLSPPPAEPAQSKKKWGTGALIGAVSAVFLVVAAVVTGLTLYQRRGEPVAPTAPASQPEAAPSGAVLDSANIKITVVDSGPGNYETALAWPGGQNDARAVPNQTLVQRYRILNKTGQTHTYKVWAYPYKMYTLSGQKNNPGSCVDLYTTGEINSYTTAAGSPDAAYLQFTEDYYNGFEQGEYHCYDNPSAGPNDPSAGQPRVLGSAGSINCSYLQTQNPESGNCADVQTLATYGQNPPYYTSAESLTIPAGQEMEGNFSIANPVCGFYQWDHGILVDDTEFIMTGSEIKFFPCDMPQTSFQCQELKVFREGVEIQASQIVLGDEVVFRGFGSAVDTTISKLRFTLTKGGVAQAPVEVDAVLASGLYQADYAVDIDTATSYSVKVEVVSP